MIPSNRRLIYRIFGRSYSIKRRTATLVLEDGSRFVGQSFGFEANVSGEVVFNTGMVGYPESLTDPSYKGQMLISTYPMVGNYGVPEVEMDSFGLEKTFESSKIQASAFIASEYSEHFSNWQSKKSLSQWLVESKIPAISGIDTRLLTKKIRSNGSLLGRIEFEPSFSNSQRSSNPDFVDPNLRNVVDEVSTKENIVYGKGNLYKVLALDCGIKNNIIRCLAERNIEVHRVPWNFDFTPDVLKNYDGLFLSNGPGNPAMLSQVVDKLRTIVDDVSFTKPIFGICMGNQLLGMAAGGSTYKMRFGNRGQNQPVINLLNSKCYITPQNHGYAIDTSSLKSDWAPLFQNKNDASNEGIFHKERPIFSAQFHPEAMGGPTDTEFLFDVFVKAMETGEQDITRLFPKTIPVVKSDVKRVLLLGSGGLSIGQAGEFDYSGNQAIKALKEEGLETIVMNPNIASVQTNLKAPGSADRVYFLPVTCDFVEQVIKKEKPDGLILSMGGQTALNVGIELKQKGILDENNVKVLGTSVDSIIATEDRGIFSEKLNEINEKLAPSFAVETIEDAVIAAEKVKYPCMIRSAFALGGLGSGVCRDKPHLIEMATLAFASSPQILVEKSMLGWKEVEYEVVRDAADNCITVCNMENFDPLGVHTGDSIVVAPSQTLSNHDYHMLRDTALKVVRHLGIIGECNIQYALNPDSDEYCIIEVNPRLSRSSALASKATGYPLAAVAAKLALGIQLPDITNAVTKTTTACFEPSLDYVVVKIPRWDLDKFNRASRQIGSAMKSVGEVMAIGRNFEETFQKAIRMVEPNFKGFEAHPEVFQSISDSHLAEELLNPTDRRVFAIAEALQNNKWTKEHMNKITKIDTWFLSKLENIVSKRQSLRELSSIEAIPTSFMKDLKASGFSDRQIAEGLSSEGTQTSEIDVRNHRKQLKVLPSIKQIDTMAGEAPANTNYLYMTYTGDEDDIQIEPAEAPSKLVLGSGTYRIGSSVEFDWCSVSAIRTLRKAGHTAIMINYNPETVSTDFDECDKLFFEELSLERVLDVYEGSNCNQAIVSVGGQIPNNLALGLYNNGVTIAGTSPVDIDRAEDRDKFSKLCDEIQVDQPVWRRLTSMEAAFDFADEVSYPVLVRPSYVLSGAAMNVAYSPAELMKSLEVAGEVSNKYPVVLSKFLENSKEIDIDAVAYKGEIVCKAISEHVENAGVHSGDATLVLPTQTLSVEDKNKVTSVASAVATELNITGPFNMQLILTKAGEVKLIETNVRASRSFPFSSKTVGLDFIEVATNLMVPKPSTDLSEYTSAIKQQKLDNLDYVGVKAPMFSFKRLLGADPTLGVEMASTGEVACFGKSYEEAFLKSLLATTGFVMPANKSVLVSIQGTLREGFKVELQKLRDLGFTVYATEETAGFLTDNDIPNTLLHWEGSGQQPSIDEHLRNKEIDMVLMFANNLSKRIDTNYTIRRVAVDFGVPLITNREVASALIKSFEKLEEGMKLDSVSLDEYYSEN